MRPNRRPLIAVIGGSLAGVKVKRDAEEVGRLIGERGAILICGGLGGVMEAAARGAKRAGGTTIGILPGGRSSDANAFIDIPIVTGMGYSRNVIIVQSASAVIALPGKFGTLTEIAYAALFEKPVVSLNSWDVVPDIPKASNPIEAVDWIFARIGGP